jgi:metal-responsive CopG/Arc/MetJ family transcriptional regulator
MSKGVVMSVARTDEITRVSVALTPELRSEIEGRAEENNMSLNRTIIQLLRAGLDAEKHKKQRLEVMLRQYRECTDPQEAERLSDELGAMIFGR